MSNKLIIIFIENSEYMVISLRESSKRPGFRDHLSYVTTFVTSLEWSLKTGLTVYLTWIYLINSDLFFYDTN